MILFQNKYRIESTRLNNWDYSSDGYYFITTCTKNRESLFGKIINAKMMLNDFGKIVIKCWFDLPNHYANLKLDEYIVMPNHFHGIMQIANEHNYEHAVVEAGFKPVSTTIPTTKTATQKHGLFEFVRALKTFSARKINELRKTSGVPVWQLRFYDRIIRNEFELNRIRKYIKKNPQNWENDELNN